MSEIKISIVTICYNEASNIIATMQSVVAQTYGNIEYIVKDGGSTDGTVEKIKEFAKNHCPPQPSTSTFAFRWESAKDGGLYKGMNAGLSMCTGDYVLFCNAGDQLAANDVIEKFAKAAEENGMPDMLYGDCIDVLDGQPLVRTAHGPGFMKMGMPASHEAIFYKLSLLRDLGLTYDPSYRIAADYKLTYQFVRAAKTFSYVPVPVVIFAEGGVSTANKWQGLMEASRARKEVSGLSLFSRLGIIGMQCCALLLSTYAKPLYRAIRLRKAK